MPTKPTDLATWGTDTNYSSGAFTGTPTKVAPAAGEAERGHYPGAKTAAQKQNWWQNVVGRWIEYFDKRFADGPIDYSLTGNVTADFTGTGDLDGVEVVRVTPDVSGRSIFGIVGGEDGKEIEIVNATTDKWFYLRKNGTATVGADVDMPDSFVQDSFLNGALSNSIRVYPKGSVRLRYDASLDSGNGRWRLVGCNGCKRATRFALSAQDGIAIATGVAPDIRSWNLTFSNAVMFSLGFLPHGTTLAGWKVYLNKITANTVTVRTFMDSWRQDSTSSNQSTSYNNDENAPGIARIPEGGGLCTIDNVHNVDSFGEVDLLDVDQSYNYVIGVNVSVGTPGGDDLLGVDVAAWTLI